MARGRRTPAAAGAAIGHIEAVARTPIMDSRDDVVDPHPTRTATDPRVDIRSASRYFGSDLGSNAARVQG